MAGRFQNLNKPVQLAWRYKGVNRIGEYYQVGACYCVSNGRKVFFISFNLLTDI
jgi:hypothetical protein